jgi:hypothetical protein
MRIWTLHPRYLDAKGLVALWRETLLAQAVLRGRTKGYRHHPQLARFRAAPAPVAAVGAYLTVIQEEAVRRGYQFDRSRIAEPGTCKRIAATEGQVRYEWRHLRKKLAVRDPERLKSLRNAGMPETHPLFRVVPGPVEDWEIR